MRRFVVAVLLLVLSGCAQWGSLRGAGANDQAVAREASEQTPPECIQGVTSSKGPVTWDDVLGK